MDTLKSEAAGRDTLEEVVSNEEKNHAEVGQILGWATALPGAITYYLGARGMYKTGMKHLEPRRSDMFATGIGMFGMLAGIAAIAYYQKISRRYNKDAKTEN